MEDLSDAKVYSELRRHYWWVGMRRNITQWTRGCIVCATLSVGRAVKPPLTPMPVAGPFDEIGVDMIQFPKTSRENQYAVVLVDYLTKWPEVFAVPDQSVARQQITRAQKHQKKVYDQGTKNPFRTGERVFLFKPAELTGARTGSLLDRFMGRTVY